ncbi:MAG: helix-turn-helix transcriptional regulator [Flavobacterium lindanitolerans]|jgi:DNA-binding CsgD family transcriptional regulator|uniref:response regulator transcription factor n=1 Tax=Flavobacterium lindanitolerans TaxID=428988 RepID=UPI001A57D04C|nr:helix-turn-helix transcriptional regulator [Flavobacterium lindanitolerans]MBL7866450.1 helix-turn-helix transcriptional regulator [Flavobacterium lindanitolerans]
MQNTYTKLNPTEQAYVKAYLEIATAFDRLTYKSIYIFDCIQKKIEYISNHRFFLHNHTPEEIIGMGEKFFHTFIKMEDQPIVSQANKAGFAFYAELPESERKSYTLAYNFHLVDENQNALLVNHRLTPLLITNEGKIWKTLGMISLATNNSPGNITLTKDGDNSILKYDIEADQWIGHSKIVLSEREIQILRFYAQGLTINGIASVLNLSADTIKFHRRNLLQKMEVNNINKALAYATARKLI